MTVKTRITLFIVGAGFIASLLFSVVVFYELIEQPFELLDNILKEEAYRTVNIIVKEQQELDSTHVDPSRGMQLPLIRTKAMRSPSGSGLSGLR
jgi:hypothetical protein